MKVKTFLFILFATVVPTLMLCGVAFADDLAEQKNNIYTLLNGGFVKSAEAYSTVLRDLSINLFWWLVKLDLIYHIVMLLNNRDPELPDFVIMLLYRIIYAGFFYMVLDHGMAISNFIFDTVVNFFGNKILDAGTGSTGWSGSSEMNPIEFMDIGFSTVFAIVEKASMFSVKGLSAMIVALVMLIVFMLIIAEIIVAVVEYYMIASIGYFLLAFGGFSKTTDMVWTYFKGLFAMSFKIMAVYAVTSICFGFLKTYVGSDADIKGIIQDMQTIMVLLGVMILFAILVKKVPATIGTMIGGVGFGGPMHYGAAGALGSAVGAAATTMVMAASMIGGAAKNAYNAKNTYNSAKDLTAAQQAGGSSAGTGGSGGGGGGGIDTGSMFGQTMKNMGSAFMHTATARVKDQYTGANFMGTMANFMDKQADEIKANNAPDNTANYTPPTANDLNSVSGTKS